MDISRISVGPNPPDEVHAVIEIPAGGAPIKYELDKASGALFVDRFLHTPMFYPANYGFIPNTLGDDGDPLDIMVITPFPLVPGCVVTCRAVGVLEMADEKGLDEKILAVPVDSVYPIYTNVKTYSDLPPLVTEQIEHFFTRYKDLEKGKSVQIKGWSSPERARELIIAAIKAYK